MPIKNPEKNDALERERPVLIIAINPESNNIEVSSLSAEKITDVKRIIDNLRFVDSYYMKVSTQYNSQTLKYAIEENQPAKVLNNIVRELTGAYPDLDKALSQE